jgi:hypothetical protein
LLYDKKQLNEIVIILSCLNMIGISRLASIIICSKFCLKFHSFFLSALFMFQAYSLTTLSGVQKSAIRDLAELGLVKLQQVKKILTFFAPYRLDDS